MKKSIIYLVLLGLSFSSFAQNSGYFGKKNVLDISFNGQYPLFSNMRILFNNAPKFWTVQDGTMVQGYDNFDIGFRFVYMRTIKRNIGIGLEFGYDYFSIQRNQVVTGFSYVAPEKMDVSSMSIMPKIEFTGEKELLPMGIAHQIGFGVRIVNPVDKPYSYMNVNGNSVFGELNKIPEIYKYTGGSVKGYTLMYAINMRTPLSKFMFLNYGLRYTWNFMSKGDYNPFSNESNLQMSVDEFRYLARQRKQYSLIQASLGLSIVF
ncbi:MAG: hypothetical protein E6Q37_00045 [Crocinitomicaceae bacterium]|nr:MAG: hypothetical protein E6Q37_00045 [Crocinitomicaceae bacterium]